MGICESDLNSSWLNIESISGKNTKNNNNSKIISLKNNKEKYTNFKLKQKKSSSNEIILNNHPNLQKYEPSKEMDNSNTISFEENSKTNEEELIIKGKLNLNCKNKENDFDNKSFMNLFKSQGGVVLKADSKDKYEINSQKENVILYDFEKDEISEINSQSSLGGISLATKKYKLDLKSESDNGKYIDYTLMHNKLCLKKNINCDSKTLSTNKIKKPKINLNNYLNNTFSINHNITNHTRNNNKQIYNSHTYTSKNYKKHSYHKMNNGCHYQNSLLSNYDNKTNDTGDEESAGSFIKAPKNG